MDITKDDIARSKATLISCTDGVMHFSDGSQVPVQTINKNKKLKKDLCVPGTDEPRIGAAFTLFKNSKGKVYLDQKENFENSRKSESFNAEIKRWLLHSCEPDEPQAKEPRQFRVLTSVIASFTNARVYPWQLFVGFNDQGERKGLNAEIPTAKDEAEFEVRFKNYVSQVLNSRSFAMTLDFAWDHSDGIKTLTISSKTKWNGDLLLLNGNTLYVRDGASSVQLKFGDFLGYVRTFKTL